MLLEEISKIGDEFSRRFRVDDNIVKIHSDELNALKMLIYHLSKDTGAFIKPNGITSNMKVAYFYMNVVIYFELHSH